VEIEVALFVPPDPSTELPSITEIVTQVVSILPTSMPRPTPIPCVLPDSMCFFERDIRGNTRWYLTLFLLALLGGFAWLNRSRVPEVAASVRSTVVGVVEQVSRATRRLIKSVPKAYLIVLEGDNNSAGKRLEIYGDTPIGRSRQDGAELLFHQEEGENSLVSRLHCTIIDEEDHFLLRDEESTNGTYLNGAPLKPMMLEELEDGDEIELGRVERGGVRLLFHVAEDSRRRAEVRDTNPTRQTRDTHDSQQPMEDRF
jgi:hypothetical protein